MWMSPKYLTDSESFSVEICDALKLASQPGPQASEIKKEKLVGIQNGFISFLRGFGCRNGPVANRRRGFASSRVGPRADWEQGPWLSSKRANGDTAGQIIELKPERIIIGRSPEHCHIVLDPNGVSRRHAEIYRKGDDYFLSDLNSRNLTRVNNAKVIPGIDHRLDSGDRINICDVEFLLSQLPPEGDLKDVGEIMIVARREQEAPHFTCSTPRAPARWRA